MTRALPIGVQDFKEIREKNRLYVDKTDMISQILSERTECYLFLRPRRFGKSLNLSMLDAFFNIKYPKDNKWFDGLKISECEECQEHKNAYPVIYFDFKDLGAESYESFIIKLKKKFSDLYSQYEYLITSTALDETDIEYFTDVFKRTVDDWKLGYCLSNLSGMLYKHHNKKVIILLDEYDNPIHYVNDKNLQNDITDVIKGMLSRALKGNESLTFGVIMGIMQIDKNSIFSGLNNIKVNNMFSSKYGEIFGFTVDEVKAICEECGHSEKYSEAKGWYDGYRFGKAEVCNPWDILNYIDEGFKPQPYWARTSGNSIIDMLLECADEWVVEELMKLSQGKSIKKSIDSTITFEELNGIPRDIYSVMAMSGYLTVVPSEFGYEVRIPNGELYQVFGDQIAKYVSRKYGHYNVISKSREFSDVIVNNDSEALENVLYQLFASTLSTAILEHEHACQLVLAMLLMNLSGKYSIRIERENEKGRLDFILEPKVQTSPYVVIELKRLGQDESESKLLTAAEDALKQIREKDYIFGMKGRIFMYGIAFKGMEAKVVSETMAG